MASRQDDIIAEVETQQLRSGGSLLRIYNYYRVLVGFTLLGVSSQSLLPTALGSLQPWGFYWLVIAYTSLFLALVIATEGRIVRPSLRPGITWALVLLDVTVLATLTYFSGGVSSGVAGLLVIAVAAASILLTARQALGVAAAATLAVLYEELYLFLTHPELPSGFFQAGALGLVYFATSIAIQNLTRRLTHSEITSMTRAVELADLERVHQRIVQRMRTGIIVAGPDDEIRMWNPSAKSLLGVANRASMLTHLPKDMSKQLGEWRSDITVRNPPFQVGPTTPEIRVNFSPVRTGEQNGDVIVFLEDTTDVQQQAQQLKLASLGRLSASIAHEIRNPLGAISHAAQLLRESTNLDRGDARLTDIIHSHCSRMNQVVENVLQMSRRAPQQPQRLPLGGWLDDVVTTFRDGQNEHAVIDVNVDPPDTQVRFDKTQMQQVIANLIANGLRYSEQQTGTARVLLVGGVDKATDRPFLNVIDYGPGVPADQVQKLFEPFYTTESTGTGLGLYISRELCEANQARLYYTPHAEGGSCFRIIFGHPNRITS